MHHAKPRGKILRHVIIILLSIYFAIWITQSGYIEILLNSLSNVSFLGILLAGMLFTSVFTTAPAIAILGQIAQNNSILEVAIIGGIGALLGDYILFRFVREDLSNDFKYILKHSGLNRLRLLSHTKLFRWSFPFVGALIIASPLPDELGLLLLGISKLKTKYFIPISFAMNTLGILAIGYLWNS